ncbi:GNAT family N-acetyltransferase [Shimia sagamensis]|uniref:L-ornithine N(alpha)-acyltransferase n=1 Tax=Shimia sagamensis TaxID=1566352 RepID=A0ABY1P3N4_9RHOB|nr:GNAT family N-acyltransferase [Shimia sagamensis]SMP23327.1 ornithine-acyl[acyl carrier protein] N-acyltransferase [Shimia sagamensis]
MGSHKLELGRYRVRVAEGVQDLHAAQRLRSLAFRGDDTGLDTDAYDSLCTHYMIEEVISGRLVCGFRMLPLNGGDEIGRSYSAQFYELDALKTYNGRMVEMGRFCVHPDVYDADVLRVAWAAMTSYVDENNVELLFGCASFAGTDTSTYLDSFAMLRDRHLAPTRWLPKVKAPKVFRFAARLRRKPNLKAAQLSMPPMLRSYLLMGGWVSDHAVVDQKMNTLHVFTGVEVKAIPAARKRLLRALAG